MSCLIIRILARATGDEGPEVYEYSILVAAPIVPSTRALYEYFVLSSEHS